MKDAISKLKSFLCDEEIPRWCGLCLVAAYVLGLAALAQGHLAHSAENATAQSVADKEDAVAVLAALLDGDEPSAEKYQPALARFKAIESCKSLRVYDRDLNVIASLDLSEVGAPLSARGDDYPVKPADLISYRRPVEAGDQLELILCAPIRGSEVVPKRFLQATFQIPAHPAASQPFPLKPWIVTLLSTVTLLIVYRMMRRSLRSVSQIAQSLRSAGDLEQELDHLRLVHESDELAANWNHLVDLTASLRDEVSRSTASSELLTALTGNQSGDLAQAMTSAPLGVMLIKGESDVCYANVMARRICNWDLDKEEGFRFDDGLSDEGKTIAEMIASFPAQQTGRRVVERVIESKDGSFFQIQLIPANTRQKLNRFVVLINDVSQRVRSDRAREDFVSQVTHELRTPLTNIRAYTETLSSGMFDDPKVITECYNVITKETRRLSRLIEDILSISQLEVGTMQLVKDDVDLKALLTESVRDVRGLAESKKIDVQLVLPPKLEPVEADRDKLAIVLNNLLGNALKYTPDNGHVVVTCQVKREEILISVKDTGIGIDESDHDRIFEKFQRSSDPDVQYETGTGIGLTTAREIVRQHGGDISLHSAKGEGSTFTVHLPLQVRSAAGVSVAQEEMV